MKSSTGICALTLAVAAIGQAGAAPVLYKATTVASGRLGPASFTYARLTISLFSDTSAVRTDVVNGAVIYRNGGGIGTVTITQTDGTTLHAFFSPREIYARYDTKLGLVGFASALGTTYPIVIGCFDPMTCSDIGQNDGVSLNAHFDGLATQLADIAAVPADANYVSFSVLNLATNLSSSTLQTGYAHVCSVAFQVYTCPVTLSGPLHTDRGDLFLMDPYLNNSRGIFTVTVGVED